jgi:RNA polymerase sigma-70 factor, ECF subfamily
MNPSPNDRDEWLMSKVAQGHPEMLEPLVRRYGTLLLSFICRMVGDRQKSEDVFQDVFLAVWRRRHLYRFPRPFKPWLYAIAINRVREVHRGHRNRLDQILEGDPATEPARVESSPSESAIATETSVLVQQAVAALPPRQQMVVAMRMWKGNSYAEIAEAMGIREATVRSNMHDALAAIRRYLEPRM